ncbi:MAG TPA: 1,4-dihydroxy-2-naphthoate octaprenyltransferase [Rhabdochlamydiaceae bacterium]|jgi:1,4-dihydroxy-2-naphthoate octaprenyltransferase|nr:1,4-dihydroxy-2-naphthoate octaprenyltransferase [Rhabdochlamydiaceae bacterium]
MKTFSIWLEASRPKTLIASISPALIGTALAWNSGSFSLLTFLLTLLTGVAIQIGTNFANDYFDFIKGADTSERKGPRRVTQAGLVALPVMRKAIIVAFALAALSSAYLAATGGPYITLLTILYIGLSLAYTAGPMPLAYLGLGDFFVLFFYGPTATLITYYLQTHEIALHVGILGLCPGLISTAILTANNLRDVNEDRKCSKKTLVVRFGEAFGKVEYIVCLVAACVIPCLYGHYWMPILLVPAVVPIKAMWTIQDKHLLNVPFAQTGKFLIVYTLLLTFSIFYGI